MRTLEMQFMTSKEVAELLNIKPQTLAKWRCTESVDLPYIKIGNRVLYRYCDVCALLEENTVLIAGNNSHTIVIDSNDYKDGGAYAV